MLSLVDFNRTPDHALTRDLAVLSTLASVGWMDTHQLHTVCFTGYTRSTVRAALRSMVDAGWINPIRWRIRRATDYQPWAITLRGVDLVNRYRPVGIQRVPQDLARPVTALEIAEWCVQATVRSFIVQLIVEARKKPILTSFNVELPGWPVDSLPNVLTVADAMLTIQWSDSVRQADNWSPWSHVGASEASQASQTYRVHVQRPQSVQLPLWLQATLVDDSTCIPVVLAHRADEVQHLLPTIQAVVGSRPVRISTWNALDTGIVSQGWKDAQGRPCSLQLQPDEVFPC